MERKPTTTTSEIAQQIADLQATKEELLADTQRAVEAIEAQMSKLTDRMIDRCRTGLSGANAVAEAVAEHRVDIGDLNCRLIDALERVGGVAEYEPRTKQRWCIVSNR